MSETTRDSLGIKYEGPVLEGMVTEVDERLRSSARANPLDPVDAEDGTWATDKPE